MCPSTPRGRHSEGAGRPSKSRKDQRGASGFWVITKAMLRKLGKKDGWDSPGR